MCIGIALMSTAPRLAAQDKPDFSGSWVLESAVQSDADVPRALAVTQSVSRTNIQGEPMMPFFTDITVTRTTQSGRRSETSMIGIVGGTMSGSSNSTPHLHHRVVWEGESLVFETGSYTGGNLGTGVWAQRRETWALDSRGGLHVEIATRSSTEAEKAISLVYQRQQ